MAMMQVAMPYMGDPAKRCHIKGCQNYGNNKCKFQKHCCQSKAGGCGKRYCNAHKHEIVNEF